MTDHDVLLKGAPRALRGLFVALASVTLATSAHVVAGGAAPTHTTFAGLVAVVAVITWLLSGRRWTAQPLLGAFLLTQLGTHVAAMVEHPADTMGGTAMVLAHVAAAVVLVLTVQHGEAALVAVVDHLGLRALHLRAVPAPLVDTPIAAAPAARSHGADAVRRPPGRAPPTLPLPV